MHSFIQKVPAAPHNRSDQSAILGRPRVTQNVDVDSTLPSRRAMQMRPVQPLLEVDGEHVNGDSATDVGHNFDAIHIYSKARTAIQPKLTISSPADESEREADRVADQVMRMPETPSPPTHNRHEGMFVPRVVQRACHCGSQPKSDEDGSVILRLDRVRPSNTMVDGSG